MVVRELERRPLRTILSILGIAVGLGTLVVGQFSGDAFEYLLEVQFSRVSREDLSVTFSDPLSARVIGELAHLPGVWRAEGVRAVPVRMQAGPRYRDVPLLGHDDGAELQRVISRTLLQAVPLPPDGLLLTKTLGDILDLRPGDSAPCS
jgi:putative ABC transport system permease protein